METLTTEQSLRIIRETIEKSRRAIARNSGRPLILWGALVTLTSLLVWALWSRTGRPSWNFLWFAMTAVGAAMMPFLTRNNEKVPVSETNRIIGALWSCFGAFACGFALLALGLNFFTHRVFVVNLTLVIALLFGFSAVLTGIAMEMKGITGSSLVATFLAVTVALLATGPAQILAIGVLGVFGLIVRGLMLQKKASA